MIEMPHLPNPHAIAMMALTVVALVLDEMIKENEQKNGGS